MSSISRRVVLVRAFQAASAAGAAMIVGRHAQGAESCVAEESESLRDSLGYVVPAPDSKQACRRCSFFAAQGGTACGHCDILSGPVDANGHCHAWAAKS